MFNISSLLNKFTKNITESDEITKEICKIIEKNTGITLSSDFSSKLEIKNFVLYVYASPIIKNKIFIHKKEILEDFSKNISVKIVDVR